jgi:hypothetical protein
MSKPDTEEPRTYEYVEDPDPADLIDEPVTTIHIGGGHTVLVGDWSGSMSKGDRR